MADETITVEKVRGMDFNELCEILDSKELDYSSLEDIEDIRDLVLQSLTDRNSSDVTSQSQEQVWMQINHLSSISLTSPHWSFTI